MSNIPNVLTIENLLHNIHQDWIENQTVTVIWQELALF